MSESNWQVKAAPMVAAGAVATVGGVAAVVSYAHMYEVATAAGEGWRANILPISVDGLVIAASLNAWMSRRRGDDVAVLTHVALWSGIAVSLAANVAVPFLPLLAGPALSAVVAAWPPVALALAFEELVRMRSGTAPERAEQGEARPERAPETVPAEPEQAPPGEAVDGVQPEREMSVCRERQSSDQGLAAEPERRSARNDRLPVILPPVAERPETVPAEPEQAPEIVPADAREAARELVRQGPGEWTGRTLAERFGRSDRWGRDQITAVRDELERRPLLRAVGDERR